MSNHNSNANKLSMNDKIAGTVCTTGLMILAGVGAGIMNSNPIGLPLLIASCTGLGALVGRIVSVKSRAQVSA